MKWRKKIVLGKIETTYGVDPTPTGAANAILASDIDLNPLIAETVERSNPRPELGAYEQIHVGTHVGLNFNVEVAGAGSAGGVPAYDPILRACGLRAINTPGVETAYMPVSENEQSATLYMPFDGQLHKLIGARGSWGVTFNRRALPMFRFGFKGLWADPASSADPEPDYGNFQTPRHVSNVNTPTASLHGIPLVLSSLEINSGNTVIHRDLVGVEEMAITDRRVTGRIRFEAPALSTKNWFTTARAGTLGALTVIHGTTAGNIVQVTGLRTQLINPTYVEEDSVAMIDAELVFVPDNATGNDNEIIISVK